LGNDGTYGSQGLKVGWGLVFKKLRVGNLAWCPDALVGRVVDIRSGPLALVCWVALHRGFPLAATCRFVALGVWNLGGDPISILLVIPILGLLGLWVGNHGGLVNQPVFGLLGLLVHNLVWRILVPVLWLSGLGIGNTGIVDPALWLLVFGIVNLLVRVDRGGEFFEKAAGSLLHSVNVDGEGVIGVDNESVEGRGLGDAGHGRVVQVLLLVLASLWVLVPEDEVDLELLASDGELRTHVHTLFVAPHLSGPNMMM